MPEAPLQSDANIVTRRESVEVITPDGKNLSQQGTKNLESIFDKIEGGKSANDAIKETMSSKTEEAAPPPPSNPETPPEKKEEAPPPKPEEHEEKKEEPKSLDDALTKTEEKNAAPPPKPDDSEVPDDELKVMPQDKPKTAKRIQALLTKIAKADAVVAETKKEVDAKAAELQRLQAQLAEVKPVDPLVQEQVKKQLEELSQYRRRYELDKDPAVQAKFDGRIKGSEESITATLKNHGAGDGLLKTIQDDGGWAKFADSTTLIQVKGEPEPITHAELAKRILDSLPYSDRRAIDQSVSEAIQAKKDKERFFDEETKKANEFFAERENAQKQYQENLQKQHTEARKLSDEFHKKLLEENDFMKDKEIPSNATPEQKAAIKEDNDWAKQIRDIHQKYQQVKTLPEILEVLKDAVKYHNERHQVAKLTAQNASLKAEIDKIRAAGKTTARSGSLAGGSAPEVPAGKKKPVSLEEALTRIEEGEKVGDE